MLRSSSANYCVNILDCQGLNETSICICDPPKLEVKTNIKQVQNYSVQLVNIMQHGVGSKVLQQETTKVAQLRDKTIHPSSINPPVRVGGGNALYSNIKTEDTN